MKKYELDISQFSKLDLYFSDFLLKTDAIVDNSVKYALAFLFFQSKLGHLCIEIEDGTIVPSGSFSLNFLAFIKDGFQKISELISEDKLKVIIKYNNSYYLHKNWIIENKIISEVEKLEKHPPRFFNSDSFKEQSHILLRKNLISNEQFLLFEKCTKETLIFLSGGPGTGKTYLATRLFEIVAKQALDIKVIITAPTGKAVSNLQEKIAALDLDFNYQAKTMHALLKLQVMQAKSFSESKLHADLIIVDEASMIDASLFSMFLSAIKERTTVIFMGDQNQLPPVDGGSPFADIVKAKTNLCVFFKQCHRFKNHHLTDALIENKCSEFLRKIQALQIYSELNLDQPAQAINTYIIPLVEKHLIVKSTQKIDPEEVLKNFENFRILNCIRQGSFGVDAINAAIYSFFCKKFSKYNFAYPILITENNFQMKLFNGMTGLIVKEQKVENAYFMIGNQLKKIPKLALPKYELGFVISVHKSQGSEYDSVYIIMPPGSEAFGRQALYTAITRAKKNITITGPLSVIEAAIRNFETKKSQISQRLKKLN